MYPYLFKIGPFHAGSYGAMLALGFLTAWYLLMKEMKRTNLNPEYASTIIISAMVGGVLGAKVYFLVQHWRDVVADPPGMIFTGNGLVWYGGLIGGALAVLWIFKKKNLPFVFTMDLIAPLLALGYVFGRLGCQLAGDGDYGIPSTLPWAMSYPHGLVPTIQRVHPTPIYEMIAFLIIFAFLWRLRKQNKPGGYIFSLYLILAGIERLLVEFIRLNHPVWLGLTEAQLFSIVMIVLGSVWLIKLEFGTTKLIYKERLSEK